MLGDGFISCNVIVLATLLSSVSITFWLFLLRSFALV